MNGMENEKRFDCESGKCDNIDILRLQVKEMLQPLELTLGVLADRWKSAGMWGKAFGTILTLLVGWGVMVLGDLNTTLRDFGIIAHQNKQEITDFKAKTEDEIDFLRNQNKSRAIDVQLLANKHNKTIEEVNDIRRHIGGKVVLKTENTTPFNPPEL
jgi:hypothetical protein